jgi:hypothetical protein
MKFHLASFSMLIQNTIVLIPRSEELVNPFVSTDGHYISVRLSVAEIDINHEQRLLHVLWRPYIHLG